MSEMRQRQYMQQMQASNAALQNPYHPMRSHAAAHPASQMAAIQAGPRMQQTNQPVTKTNSPEHFIRSLSHWMQQRGLSLNPHPTVAGRPINLMTLFSLVVKMGGSKAVSARSQWQMVAQGLQIPPAQQVMAAQELQSYWQTNLLPYEAHQLQIQQQRQRAINDQIQMSRQNQAGGPGVPQDPFSPMKQMNAHSYDQSMASGLHARGPVLTDFSNSDKRGGPPPHENRNQTNRVATVPPMSSDGRYPPATGVPLSRAQPASKTLSSPQGQQTIPSSDIVLVKGSKNKPHPAESSRPRRLRRPLSPLYRPIHDVPPEGGDDSIRHGGFSISTLQAIGDRMAAFKPKLPLPSELGIIDIRALTMSLRSGIKGEVRLALDTLFSLSYSISISLEECEDLVDVLVECAEEQIELLAEHAPEVSDAMLIVSYEEMVRGSKVETSTLQEIPEFGSLEYDLDRAVERLICVSTILRNLSTNEINHRLLADPAVIRFLTMVIRHLGTRNMLLRTHSNTLDFAKDIVIYFTNLSQQIDLPGKDEALCVLQFLLSFAPCPPPSTGATEVVFTSFSPSLHPYLPHAIDSFAKLLAKDEPNRMYYRSILAADGASNPPFDLFTKTFGLAIAPVPERLAEYWSGFQRDKLFAIVQARGPYLAQGLLAAELLVSLMPTSEHTLAHAWLSSQDGFAPSLLRTVSVLGGRPAPQPSNNPRILEIESMYNMVAHRGIAVLRKLAEKAKGADKPLNGVLWGIFPQKEYVIENLLRSRMQGSFLRQLCAYAAIDS